jgi:hypothetical protein
MMMRSWTSGIVSSQQFFATGSKASGSGQRGASPAQGSTDAGDGLYAGSIVTASGRSALVAVDDDSHNSRDWEVVGCRDDYMDQVYRPGGSNASDIDGDATASSGTGDGIATPRTATGDRNTTATSAAGEGGATSGSATGGGVATSRSATGDGATEDKGYKKADGDVCDQGGLLHEDRRGKGHAGGGGSDASDIDGEMEEQRATQARGLADEFERDFYAERSEAGQPEPGKKASTQAPSFQVREAMDRVRSRENPNRSELGAAALDNNIRSRRSVASGIMKMQGERWPYTMVTGIASKRQLPSEVTMRMAMDFHVQDRNLAGFCTVRYLSKAKLSDTMHDRAIIDDRQVDPRTPGYHIASDDASCLTVGRDNQSAPLQWVERIPEIILSGEFVPGQTRSDRLEEGSDPINKAKETFTTRAMTKPAKIDALEPVRPVVVEVDEVVNLDAIFNEYMTEFVEQEALPDVHEVEFVEQESLNDEHMEEFVGLETRQDGTPSWQRAYESWVNSSSEEEEFNEYDYAERLRAESEAAEKKALDEALDEWHEECEREMMLKHDINVVNDSPVSLAHTDAIVHLFDSVPCTRGSS